MNPYPAYQDVQSCLLLIERKLNWGSSADWRNEAFEELSQHIQRETSVLLSATTLKRVWGKVNYINAPSITTLNALAQFAGYEHWRDFKHQNIGVQSQSETVEISDKRSYNKRLIITSAALLTLVFISFYSLIVPGTHSRTHIDYNKVAFSSQPVTEGLPNSVVFDFKWGETHADSFFIQQSWDKTKTIKIDKDREQATGIYYYPGYFKAKLIADTIIAREHDLFIKSNTWLSTIDYEPIPKYEQTLTISADALRLSDELIEEVSMSKSPLQTSFHIVDEFYGLTGDDFKLDAKFRHILLDKWATCQKMRLIIMGKSGVFIVPFSIPGCASDIGLYLNGTTVSGKEKDLSQLCDDFSAPKSISVRSKNKMLSISIEDELRSEFPFDESIGEIIGFRFRFIGAGEIEHLQVTDSSEQSYLNI